MVVVRMEHCRAANLCARGVRDFMRRHGFDYRAFLTDGLPLETVAGTGEHFALLACEQAEKESSHG